jgi:SPIRAL1-like protein
VRAQQNLGNFISDRASSRVLAPPGGRSSVWIGDDTGGAPLAPRPPPARHTAPGPPTPRALYAATSPHARAPPGALAAGADAPPDNNYTREVSQNVGNWLTERRTVRVAGGTPGGASQIVLG